MYLRPVEYQLRMYMVRPGEMPEWISEWHHHVAPLRRKFGFEILGPWVIEEEDRFVWILGYNGEAGWAAADTAYYESEERRTIEPDPARHLARIEQWMMRPG
jgi:hypothetical protein